jgi:cytidine deaminase
MRGRNWLQEATAGARSADLARSLMEDLRGTQFMDIGEFSRPVHAEMAAIIDAARRGVSVDGLTMFVTTFPCHNCAKHIIATGIRKVVYLEPYPKSRANLLHGDEIELESVDGKEVDGKVVFCAFTGIAPRQYERLFAMSERGAKKGMRVKEWEAAQSGLRPKYVLRNAPMAYLAAEREELRKLSPEIYKWHQEEICPPWQKA